MASSKLDKVQPSKLLLMHAMGPNVAGVIGSAVVAESCWQWSLHGTLVNGLRPALASLYVIDQVDGSFGSRFACLNPFFRLL